MKEERKEEKKKERKEKEKRERKEIKVKGIVCLLTLSTPLANGGRLNCFGPQQPHEEADLQTERRSTEEENKWQA